MNAVENICVSGEILAGKIYGAIGVKWKKLRANVTKMRAKSIKNPQKLFKSAPEFLLLRYVLSDNGRNSSLDVAFAIH